MRGRRPASHGGRATGPTYFADERLETGDPRIARRRLRTIEADLNAAGVKEVEGLVVQGQVTEGFQQAAGDILQAAEQLHGCSSKLGRQVAQQAAGFHDCRIMWAICNK